MNSSVSDLAQKISYKIFAVFHNKITRESVKFCEHALQHVETADGGPLNCFAKILRVPRHSHVFLPFTNSWNVCHEVVAMGCLLSHLLQ